MHLQFSFRGWTYHFRVDAYQNIWHKRFRKQTEEIINKDCTEGYFPRKCWCGANPVVHCQWFTESQSLIYKSFMCDKHATEFQKTWGHTSSGQSAIWIPIEQDGDKEEHIIFSNGKGT